MRLLLASNNTHKLREIQDLFDYLIPSRIQLLIPSQLSTKKIDVEENGKDIFENSFLKANAFYQELKIPCISDDTGLFIDFLNGAPGKDAAYFAGEYGNDAKNRLKTLDLLNGKPSEKRTAHFISVVCYFDGEKAEYFEGRVDGNITFFESGKNGFGYDSIFQPEGYDITFADMSEELKNAISHRGKALSKFIEFIKRRI